MRKIICILITLTLVCTTSCSIFNKDQYNEVALQQDLVNYWENDYSMCAENISQIKYNQLSERELKLLQAFQKNCRVLEIVDSYPNFTFTVEHPDSAAIFSGITEDVDGIGIDYLNLREKGASQDEVKTMVDEYVCNLLQFGQVPLISTGFTVTIGSDDKWISDEELFQVALDFVQTDFISALPTGSAEQEVAEQEPSEVQKVNANGSFIYSEEGIKFLVKDISIKEGADAIAAVHSLSKSNSAINVAARDRCWYVEYTIRNLSNKGATANDYFVLAEDDVILRNVGSTVSGLRSVANLEPGNEAQFAVFLVGSSNGVLLWYSPDIIGSYQIVVP